MKRLLLLIFLLGYSLHLPIHAEPVRLIFDTDMGNDVDDLIALSAIHSLQTRGACELLAVTISKDHPQAAPCVDAVNTFYGRPDIPVGVVREGVTREAGRFNLLAKEKLANGELRYPHDLEDGSEAPDAVDVLMKTLAAQPDKSVTIVQVGFFTNLSGLLKSDGGKELVAKKVKSLCLMAGAFQTVDFKTHHPEYNVRMDIPSAEYVTRNWPTEMVWCGFEIGIAVTLPHEVIEFDLDYMPHHILKEAYYLYKPPPHDRPCWDPATVLYAVMPDRGYFGISEPGTVAIEAKGVTSFRLGKEGKGNHRILTASPEQIARASEAIVHLSIEPPRSIGVSPASK